jgi:hypothetical protein
MSKQPEKYDLPNGPTYEVEYFNVRHRCQREGVFSHGRRDNFPVLMIGFGFVCGRALSRSKLTRYF